jgi:glycosyltransferase involved in cell wall biosynthesis
MEVSVVTPTYNRRQFIPALIEIYNSQTFPKDKTEWIILDDGRDKVEDLFTEAAKTIPNIRYIYSKQKMRIGAKRNRLNKEATGTIIIAMDDDDFYPPTRFAHVVSEFNKHPHIDLAGSSEMYLYYIRFKSIYKCGPYGSNHATNGTMAWRKRYADTHEYDNYVTKAEETVFLENYTNTMIQLNPLETILVVCHTDNTVDKHILLNKNNPFMELTEFTLNDFVKNNKLLQFYSSL